MRHRLIGWIRYVRRFAASFYLLNKNALLGRSFVPHPRHRLFVETTGFCNLECGFCSYPQNVRPRTVMAEEVFRRSIDQAAAMGYRHIVLTPITGDVFTDKKFVERLGYIERSEIDSADDVLVIAGPGYAQTNVIGAVADFDYREYHFGVRVDLL